MSWLRPFKQPPSLKAVRNLNLCVAVFCLSMMILGPLSWALVVDGFIIGTSLAGAGYAHMMIRTQTNIDDLVDHIKIMAQMNEQLTKALYGKITAHLSGDGMIDIDVTLEPPDDPRTIN